MSGEEAIKKIKETNKEIPVIALTADAVVGAEEKYLKEGFIGYLAKPFKREELIKKISNIVNNKDEEDGEIDWDNVPAVVIGSSENDNE